jgi:multicomponent Na+:H+ antiporter subunit D
MSAGSVLFMTGKRKCTDLGGLIRTMPVTALCGIIGALSISSFPLTSGFVTKSMISAAAGHQHLELVWYLLAAASAGVFLHAGIKFPWFVFFQKDSGLRPDEPPWNMRAAMVLFAVLCIAIGVAPGPLYALLPFPVDYEPYTAGHVVFYLQLLLFSGLAFFLMLGWLKRTLTITLDVDWFYRRLGPAAARRLDAMADAGWDGLVSGVARSVRAIAAGVQRLHGPGGILARPWPTGSMAFWATVMLALYSILSYL